MTRRKQNCPKRMKWDGEGGEGKPEDLGEGQEEEDGIASGEEGEEGGSTASTAPSPPLLDPNVTNRESISPSQGSLGRDSIGSRVGTPLSPTASIGYPIRPMSSSPTVLVPQSPPSPAALDFSTKRLTDSPVLNLSNKSISPPICVPETNSPLDLSVGTRKRSLSPPPLSPNHKKPLRPTPEFKAAPALPPWTSPVVAQHFPYFAAAVAAANSLSPKANNHPELWNGKMKMHEKNFGVPPPSEATKALEKMSELSKLGGDDYRPSSGRKHSAWQSHWLNKGADLAKVVFTCVWCKQSFPSHAAMTQHMKEAKHCGVNLPSPMIPPAQSPMPPQQIPISSPASHQSAGNGKSTADLNLLIKETMPLPRKLVRGQDVWLGKGAEQTRQILKCMWCGQSFKSLDSMSAHMQETQHYQKIISQEQIISWKSAEEGKGSTNNNTVTNINTNTGNTPNSNPTNTTANSDVSSVMTCRVCKHVCDSLSELSNHMMKNAHYKEHITRSIAESGNRRRQTREKRKKSLPVRKLLELERAQNELKNGEGINFLGKSIHESSPGKITCEKCKEKIDMSVLVEHIRLCVGGDSRNILQKALLSSTFVNDPIHEKKKTDRLISPSPTELGSIGSTSPKEGITDGKGSSPSVLNAIEKLIEKSFDSRGRHGSGGFVGPGMPQAPIGSSILKRLGIDESVDYTKPLIDPQTMNILRSYQHQNSQNYLRRERSGSESSSVSDRGRAESLTPDKKYETDRHTPRSTPDIKREPTPTSNDETPVKENINIKKEPNEDSEPSKLEIAIKQEVENGNEEEDDRKSYQSDEPLSKRLRAEEIRSPTVDEDDDNRSQRTVGSPTPSPRQRIRSPSGERPTPSPRNSSSPASSDRSATNTPRNEKKTSLGALSSMFDNLPGGSGSGNTGETNKSTSHPLAALQKLCDKTETHPPPSNNRQLPATPAASPASPGSILAFSWACNDAVVTDSIMKCAFCDTPFISKGAYRHHLSKMHFVKDGVIPEPVTLKAPSPGTSSSSIKNGSSSSSMAGPSKSPQAPPPTNNFEESPHSKFLKYTELAKQLSSKYV